MALTDKLSAIGDAIRAKTGGTDMLTLDQMPTAIAGIQTGSGSGGDYNIIVTNNSDGTQSFAITDASGSSGGTSDELAKKIITGEGDITELPSGITKIRSSVFAASSNLKITYIPDGVTSIGGTSFQNCQNLITISIPNSVTSIGFLAFNNCLNLTTVIFKGTPTDIYSNAFSNCDKITDIYVPWSSGAVADAPWGATNATIHYNTTT